MTNACQEESALTFSGRPVLLGWLKSVCLNSNYLIMKNNKFRPGVLQFSVDTPFLYMLDIRNIKSLTFQTK